MSIRTIEMDFETDIVPISIPAKAEAKPGNFRSVDISKFKESKELAGNTSWLLQLKGFNREARISRHLTQVHSGVTGSATDREISPGAVMIFPKFPIDRISQADAGPTFLVKDSRGMVIDDRGRNCYFASVDTVFKLQLDSLKLEEVISSDSAPLAFIHSLSLSTDKQRMLVTSSGLDRIVEVDLRTGAPARQWSAWEHGYNRAKKSGKLVFPTYPYPQPEEDFQVIDIGNHGKGLGLPPAERTAFPNSAIYRDDDIILATMFHHGLVQINLNNGETTTVDPTLIHPHSVLPFGEGFIEQNTAEGQAKLYDSSLKNNTVLDFTNLPGLDPDAENHQWLQHVHPISDNKLVAVDSNRASIFVVDLNEGAYQRIPYQENWVIQEAHPLPISG